MVESSSKLSFSLYSNQFIMVEYCGKLVFPIRSQGIERKAFQSVKQLREHLRQYIVTYNKHSAKPFVWKKPAQQVLDSVERAKQHAAAQTSPVVL